jgi:hypothetical protein
VHSRLQGFPRCRPIVLPLFGEHVLQAFQDREHRLASKLPEWLHETLHIFNAFNNVNYGNPNTVFGSATFGRISATNTPYPNMRQVQFGGKSIF